MISATAKLLTAFFITKAEGQGTRLGLSIGYQIVTQKHWVTWKCLSSLEGRIEFAIGIPM
ncbi:MULTISPECIES: hypothetical protein [unclassified Microcoleus]|uniref:hypothetical protein n=1 Tax=unclassified Microcoleus TaxID=2642155 RepID=UPI002FD215F8